VPQRVSLEAETRLSFYLPSADRAKYTVFRIPTSQLLAFEGSDWDRAVREALTVVSVLPVEEWTQGGTEWSSAAGWRWIQIRNAAPGVYALREELEDLTVLHPFAIRTFDVACVEEGRQVAVWVIDSRDGTPKEGARLEVRFADLGRRVDGRTGADGLFTYELPEADSASWIRVRLADEVSAMPGPYARDSKVSRESLVSITTDRPIYRPGATVHYRAVRRDRASAALHLPPREKVRVELRDPRGRVLDHTEPEWSASGSVWGSFRLADEPPLGEYHVVVHTERRDGGAYFDWVEGSLPYWSQPFTVAAYRRPEMEVAVDLQGTPVGGATLRARISAEYFFGGPAAGAEVRWWLARFEQRLPKEREASYRPPLGDSRAWIYERFQRGRDGAGPIFAEEEEGDGAFDDSDWAGRESVAEGRGTLRDDGSLDIEVRLPERDPEGFELVAAVRDASRLVATGRVDFVVQRPVSVHVTSDRLFYASGETMEVQVRTSGAAGAPLVGKDVEVVLFAGRKLVEDEPVRPGEQPPFPEFKIKLDRRDPWAGHEFESFFVAAAKTGDRGLARLRVPVERGGLVRVLARARDDQGRESTDRTHLRWTRATIATDPSKASDTLEEREEQSAAAPFDLEIVPDRVVYDPGETVRILVRSTRVPVHALLTVGGDRLHTAHVVRLERRETVLAVPVTEAHAPNAFVHVLARHDGRAVRKRHEVFVYPRASVLDVAVSSDREAYGPGEKAKVTVTTRSGGAPVPAEVELSLVDASVLTFAAEDRDNMLSLFLPRRFSSHILNTSIVGLWEDERSEADRWEPDAYDSSPICFAGAAEEESDHYEAAMPRVRRDFPETLFWRPHLETSIDGRAEVEVEMPDSLTEWRVLARAASGVDRFGSAASRVLSRQSIVLRLAAPRFLVAEDEAVVATVLHNHLERESRFRVSLAASGAEVEPSEERAAPVEVSVPAGGSRRVDWRLRAPSAGSLALRASATGKAGADAVEVTIPVLEPAVERKVTAGGVVRGGRWSATLELPAEAVAGSASLEVRASHANAEVIRGALGYLAGYPYGCVEQTMSRFLPVVVALRAMERAGIESPPLARELPEMIAQGLQRLYGFQHDDGGWGWWENDETEARMTAYVLFGLAVARQAGVEVDELAWKRGLDALGTLKVLPESVLVHALAGKPLDREAHPEPSSLIDHAYLVLAGRKDLAAELTAPEGDGGPWEVLETALVLKAHHSVDPSGALVPDLVERLLGLRRGDAWHSTLDTAWAVYALTDVMPFAAGRPEPAWKLHFGGREHLPQAGRVVVSAPQLSPGPLRIEVESSGGAEAVFGSAVLTFRCDGEALRQSESGIDLGRVFQRFQPDERGGSWVAIQPGDDVRIGESLRGVVTLRSERGLSHILLECPLPAGAEAIRYRRRTDEEYEAWNEAADWRSADFCRRELHDDRVLAAAAEVLPYSPLTLIFGIRATHPGVYHVLPARVFEMYDPDRAAWSESFVLRVKDR
jgi:hypothetical protein